MTSGARARTAAPVRLVPLLQLLEHVVELLVPAGSDGFHLMLFERHGDPLELFRAQDLFGRREENP